MWGEFFPFAPSGTYASRKWLAKNKKHRGRCTPVSTRWWEKFFLCVSRNVAVSNYILKSRHFRVIKVLRIAHSSISSSSYITGRITRTQIYTGLHDYLGYYATKCRVRFGQTQSKPIRYVPSSSRLIVPIGFWRNFANVFVHLTHVRFWSD